jgi:hypothetical protein
MAKNTDCDVEQFVAEWEREQAESEAELDRFIAESDALEAETKAYLVSLPG